MRPLHSATFSGLFQSSCATSAWMRNNSGIVLTLGNRVNAGQKKSRECPPPRHAGGTNENRRRGKGQRARSSNTTRVSLTRLELWAAKFWPRKGPGIRPVGLVVSNRCQLVAPACAKTLTLFWKIEIASQFRRCESRQCSQCPSGERNRENHVQQISFSYSLGPRRLLLCE